MSSNNIGNDYLNIDGAFSLVFRNDERTRVVNSQGNGIAIFFGKKALSIASHDKNAIKTLAKIYKGIVSETDNLGKNRYVVKIENYDDVITVLSSVFGRYNPNNNVKASLKVNKKITSVSDAKLTSAYSVVGRNDGKLRIVNEDGITVFTIWVNKITNTVSILTASDNVCKSIKKYFPRSRKTDTKHHGNNKYIIYIDNSSLEEVLNKCFNSHSDKFDKQALAKQTDKNRHSEKTDKMRSEIVSVHKKLVKKLDILKTNSEKMVFAINEYVLENGTNTILHGEEILYLAGLSDKKGNIFPTDFCYNRYNFGLKEFKGPFLFAYVGVDTFRALGEGYSYSGQIVHHPKHGTEVIVGEWKKGKKHMFEDVIVLAEMGVIDVPEDESEQQRLIEKMTVAQLEKVAANRGNKHPEKLVSQSSQYKRNLFVAEYAKQRAKGVCQLCGQKAPFLTKTGNPYLETHHVVWLSRGGEDTIDNVVALCPNCHRRMHELDDPKDLNKLTNI